MRIVLACLATLLSVPAVFAQTYYTSTDIPVLVKSSSNNQGDTIISARKENLDDTIAVSQRSVKLASDVTFGAAGNSVQFKQGQILFGRYDKTVWTYCGISNMTAASAGLNILLLQVPDKQIACLFDEDDDGIFDSGWSGGDAMNSTSMVAYSLNGPHKLSEAPAYERIKADDGPGMPVELKWTKSRNSAVISFHLEISGKRTAQTAVPIPSKGGPANKVTIAGAEYNLVSYDADEKTITVEVVKPLPRRFTTLKATRVTTRRTTYVPVYY